MPSRGFICDNWFRGPWRCLTALDWINSVVPYRAPACAESAIFRFTPVSRQWIHLQTGCWGHKRSLKRNLMWFVVQMYYFYWRWVSLTPNHLTFHTNCRLNGWLTTLITHLCLQHDAVARIHLRQPISYKHTNIQTVTLSPSSIVSRIYMSRHESNTEMSHNFSQIYVAWHHWLTPSEWVSSFLIAHQHIIGYIFSAMQW